jgi:hypothetical protein
LIESDQTLVKRSCVNYAIKKAKARVQKAIELGDLEKGLFPPYELQLANKDIANS